MVNWSKNNNLSLNAEKCNVISFTRNKKHIQATYDIEEEQLERVKKGLGCRNGKWTKLLATFTENCNESKKECGE